MYWSAVDTCWATLKVKMYHLVGTQPPAERRNKIKIKKRSLQDRREEIIILTLLVVYDPYPNTPLTSSHTWVCHPVQLSQLSSRWLPHSSPLISSSSAPLTGWQVRIIPCPCHLLSKSERMSQRKREGARQTIFTDRRRAATSHLHLEESNYSIGRRRASTDGERAGGRERLRQ